MEYKWEAPPGSRMLTCEELEKMPDRRLGLDCVWRGRGEVPHCAVCEMADAGGTPATCEEGQAVHMHGLMTPVSPGIFYFLLNTNRLSIWVVVAHF